jgi:hypothetical protein
MINEFETYHGLVFSRLVHGRSKRFSIEPFPTPDNASYIVDEKIGIYVKYSSKRMSPWRFSFHKRHQDELLSMRNKLSKVFLLLVCRTDGIVALDQDEIDQILDEIHGPVEWIRVARPPRGMYSVTGSDGKLKLKVGIRDFPNKLF